MDLRAKSRPLSRMLLILYSLLTFSACANHFPAKSANQFVVTTSRFNSIDAVQGVAVDEHFVYAINNSSISKHRKQDGMAVKRWKTSARTAHIKHLNSGVIYNGRLYAAHSNWPSVQANNTIEVWDASSLNHLLTVSLPFNTGYINWLDRSRGHWWAGLADYPDRRSNEDSVNFARLNTRVVKLNDKFDEIDFYQLPLALLSRLHPMSNSGGSWGPDNVLYLTSHDFPKVYVMRVPSAANILDWVFTIGLPDIRGQGIAWERGKDAPYLL